MQMPGPIDLMSEADFALGAVQVRPREGLMTLGGAAMRLEPRLMQVLIALNRDHPEVATRRRLSELAWGDVIVGEDALNRAIARLRKHLGGINAPLRIETVPKIGYRLIVEAPIAAPQQSAPADATARSSPPRGQRFAWSPREWKRSLATLGVLALTLASAGLFVGNLAYRAPQAFVLGEVTRLGDAETREFDPALSPDGTMLAYAKGDHAATTSALYVRRATGGGERRLNDDESVINPAWSPNGQEIAYSRVRSGAPCTLVVASATTGARRDVGACRIVEGTTPAWSQDGARLFFHDQATPQSPMAIFTLELADGAIAQVTRPQEGPGDMFANPSPDGAQLAFLRETAWRSGQIVVRDLATGQDTQITRMASDIYGIAWEPGAAALLVTSNLGGDVGLWRAPLDRDSVTRLGGVGVNYAGVSVGGGNRIAVEVVQRRVRLERLGQNGERTALGGASDYSHADSDPDIAADGALAFVSYRSGRSQLWVASAGEAPRQLTEAGLDYLGGPRWSPDGGAIAASIAQAGRQDIVLFDRNGRQSPLMSDAAIDITPQWISGGRELLFISNRGGEWGAWAVSRTGGAPRSVMANARLAAMDSRGGLLFQPTDKPGLWYLAPGARQAQQASPASLSSHARVHCANGAFWVLDRAEGRTMQVWRYTPANGLAAVPGASGPFYPKSQITFDAQGAIVVATLTGVDNDLLVADLLPQMARSPFNRTFGFLNREEKHAALGFDLTGTTLP